MSKIVNDGKDREFVNLRPQVNLAELFFDQAKGKGGSRSILLVMRYNIANHRMAQKACWKQSFNWKTQIDFM